MALRDLSAKLLVVGVPIDGVFSEEPFDILDLLFEHTGEPFRVELREGLRLSRPLFDEPRYRATFFARLGVRGLADGARDVSSGEGLASPVFFATG